MLVKEVMNEPSVVLHEETPVREAASALISQGAIAAPVVDDRERLAGIVTEIDLLRDRFEPDPRASVLPVSGPLESPARQVAEVMTRAVVTTGENTDVAELAERMVHNRIRCVPVLRQGSVVGLVTRTDLLRVHTRSDEQIHADVLRAMSDGGPYLHGWSVRVEEGIVHISGEGLPAEERLAGTIARTVPGVSRVVVDRD